MSGTLTVACTALIMSEIARSGGNQARANMFAIAAIIAALTGIIL